MAKVGKETIRQRDKNDRDYYIEITVGINVGADGYFSATLEQSDIELIKSYGIDLYSSSNTGSKSGFFRNDTKEKLITEINETLRKCLSKELIRDAIVLKYAFSTACSFGFTEDGNIVPNMGWGEDGPLNEELGWRSGTILTHAASPRPTTVQMYIKPYHKKTYKYANGEEKTFYNELTPFGHSSISKSNYYLRWLEAICSTVPPSEGGMQEVEYTEERAKFFVNMYKSMCKLAYSIAQFSKPEELVKLIETGKYLM